MTKEEVYETEKAAGVLLQEDEIYTWAWRGSIAGQANAKLELYIQDDKGLTSVVYNFPSVDSYHTLNNALITKYGETPYNSDTGRYFNKTFTYQDGMEYDLMYTTAYSNAKWSQWIIPYSDTQSIAIYHYCYEKYYEPNSIGQQIGKTDSGLVIHHVISYDLLSEYETKQYNPNLYINDL